MRKLASIQLIKELHPIEGADKIEIAKVLGWQLVVKKGEFKVGDRIVYVEIDSILPDKPEFEFMKPRGMRVRTIRLRGVVSQGLCLPLSILHPIDNTALNEDVDVTNILEIEKYETPIPACLTGVIKGKFPSFIPKTDETRVQVLQKVLDKYKDGECYITEKLDGSSATFYLNNGEFGVCSRNMDLLEDDKNSFWKVARELDIENKLRELAKGVTSSSHTVFNIKNIAIQGELIGENIQGNKYNIKGHTVRFFNVFDIDNFKYLDFSDFSEVLNAIDLPTVPIIHHCYKLSNNIDELIEKSKMKSTLNNKVWAEGIVIRPLKEQIDLLLSTNDFNNGRVSLKVINTEFLISNDE